VSSKTQRSSAPSQDGLEEISAKIADWSLLARLLKLLLPYWFKVLASLLGSLAATFLQIVNPLILSVAIDVYFLKHAPSNSLLARWLPADPHKGIVLLSGCFLAVLFLSVITESSQNYLAQWTGQLAMADLRRELVKKLHLLPINFYDVTPAGRMVTRLTTDVEALSELFSNGIVSILANVLMTLVFLAGMLSLNARMTLVLAAVLPLFIALTVVFRRMITRSQQRVRILIARINSFIAEHVNGISIVQLFNREAMSLALFDDVNREHMDASKQWVVANAWFLPSIELLGTISQAGLLVMGAYLLAGRHLTIGTLVAFLQYGSRFLRPIQEISERYGILQTSIVSAEKVFVLLDTEIPPFQDGHQSASSGAATIEFDHVWFAYKGDSWVLRDVSFVVEPGEMLALVGHTGAGKTTLSNLLLRFYEPQRGVIRIGGIDIREIKLAELRRQFGVVLQDSYLREGTILDNVRFGDEELDDARIAEAIRTIGLDTMVQHLPAGLETWIQERGDNLSSGQKQLIAFSRALAHQPQYLLLDEATSNIDLETEARLRLALDPLFHGRTSIVIAHRLSTILAADKILVMHRGRVAERGNHAELMAMGGLYWRLYQIQLGQQTINNAEIHSHGDEDRDIPHSPRPRSHDQTQNGTTDYAVTAYK
jgi:ATP-binding cassette, subfamily B, multidrug efflux pump